LRYLGYQGKWVILGIGGKLGGERTEEWGGKYGEEFSMVGWSML
jgi:hypothetical protein